MEERAMKKTHSVNKNENRKRLKVKDNPSYNLRYKEKQARKNDRIIKIVLSLITIGIIGSQAFLTMQKRNELLSKRYEYNELVKDVISKELKRDRLEAKLENSIDLNRIQRYALENLGMIYVSDNKSAQAIEESKDRQDGQEMGVIDQADNVTDTNEDKVDGVSDDGSDF